MLTEQEHNLLVAAYRFHRKRVYGKDGDSDEELKDLRFRIDRIEYEIKRLKTTTTKS